jgi:hypothetical protein
MLYSLTQSRVTTYVLIAATALVLTLIIARLTEDPERKRARKMLNEITNRGLTVTAMQLDGEGNPLYYDEANDLLRQSTKPEADARKAYKDGRYGVATYNAARALDLINEAIKKQNDMRGV